MKLSKLFFVLLPYIIILNIFLVLIGIDLSFEFLSRLIPLFLLVNYLLLLLFLAIIFKYFRGELVRIDKKVWILLIIIILFGFSLRMFATPHAHRVFFDEDIYLNIAQNIKNEMQACLCDYGTTDECFSCIPNKQPNAFAAFISIFFFIFGVSENVAHNVSAIISSLSILLVFLAAYFLFKKQSTALYAALIFSLIPEHILWSGTVALGPFFVFSTLLTVTLFLLFIKTEKYSVLAAAILSLAIALQGRPEASLLFIVIGLLFILFDKKIFNKLSNYRTMILLLLLCILITPSIIHLKKSSSDTWGSSGKKLGLEFVENNARDNSRFFFENTRFPILFTILALIGFIYSLIFFRRESILLLVWFFIFFGMFAVFYAGSFNFGTDVRFSLNLYGPVAIFAGLSLSFIEDIIIKIRRVPGRLYGFKKSGIGNSRTGKINIYRWIVRISIIILILSLMIPFVPHITSYGTMVVDAKDAHDFAVNESKKLKGKNCYVFSHASSLFLVNGVNSIQTHMNSNSRVINNLFKKTDCVLFYEGYWCAYVYSHRSGICKMMHDNFDLEIYSTYSGRNKNFTFYKVNRK